jgi:hypothetical protein
MMETANRHRQRDGMRHLYFDVLKKAETAVVIIRGRSTPDDSPAKFAWQTLDSHDCLYVADTMNARIQKFSTA